MADSKELKVEYSKEDIERMEQCAKKYSEAELENMFQKVKSYLRMNGGSTLKRVAFVTKIEKDILEYFVYQERLEFKTNNSREDAIKALGNAFGVNGQRKEPEIQTKEKPKTAVHSTRFGGGDGSGRGPRG